MTITVEKLSRSFGEIQAVKGIDLDVDRNLWLSWPQWGREKHHNQNAVYFAPSHQRAGVDQWL